MNHLFEMPGTGEAPIAIFESSLNPKTVALRQNNEDDESAADLIYIPKDRVMNTRRF